MGLNFLIFSIFQLINCEQYGFEHCDSKLVYGIRALPINWGDCSVSSKHPCDLFFLTYSFYYLFFLFSLSFSLHPLFWDEIDF